MRDQIVHGKAENGLTDCGLLPYGRRVAQLPTDVITCSYCLLKRKLYNGKEKTYEPKFGTEQKDQGRARRRNSGGARKGAKPKAVRESKRIVRDK